MPDEVNIDDLLELETEEERTRKIQVVAKDCAPLPRTTQSPPNSELCWLTPEHSTHTTRTWSHGLLLPKSISAPFTLRAWGAGPYFPREQTEAGRGPFTRWVM